MPRKSPNSVKTSKKNKEAFHTSKIHPKKRSSVFFLWNWCVLRWNLVEFGEIWKPGENLMNFQKPGENLVNVKKRFAHASWILVKRLLHSKINKSHMLHVWNIYQHLPYKWPSHVGKYTIHGAYWNTQLNIRHILALS
jgi:hypothetical protein